MYDHITIGDKGSDRAIENKLKIVKIITAINEIMHESHGGHVRDELLSGQRKFPFEQEHLEIGYRIFKEIIKNDLEKKAVSVNILRLARDPAIALINVVERVAGVDIMNKDEEDATEAINNQLYDALEGPTRDQFDQNTVRLVALHKALHLKDNELFDQIESKKLSEDQMNEFLFNSNRNPSGLKVVEVQQFPEREPNVKNTEKYFKKLERSLTKAKMMPSQTTENTDDHDDESDMDDSSEDERFFRKWNKDDGCTNSILSSKSEKDNLMVDVNFGGIKGNFTRINLLDLVDNIEDMSVFAENMTITKNQFINCLREVTRQKIYGVRQAKRIFEQRIKKLQIAQSYEVQNQKVYAINTAQEVFLEKAQ